MAAISITTPGAAYLQNFNMLSNTAGSTTNTLTIDGWAMTETGGGTRDNEQYAVDTGGSNTGDTFSYGAAVSSDRALGSLQSGTLIPVIGASFTNNTGATITSLQIAFTGEQWRIGNTAAARDDRLDFQYSLDATSIASGTWSDVNQLDFTNPIKTTGTAGALDGNAAANRTAISHTITGLSIPEGATFFIRWNDLNSSGADDGLAIDDFSLTAITGVATPTLSINDVTANEGSTGLVTSYTFTVSLTAPAPAGGVTFDIATADGSATAGSDYVAKSLTGQTIPAGSSTYSFTVDVNADTVVEPNEGFVVNITNVTGATAGDVQGAGTITNDDVAPGSLAVGDVTIAEGNSGTTAGSFTVTRSGGSGGTVTADFVITLPGGVGGADGSDVTGTLTGTVSFADGETSKTIDFTVNGDRTVETDETFTVVLSSPTGGATISDDSGTATITNDDVAGSVSVGNVSIAEGNSGSTNATITLTRTGGTGDFTVNYATGGGTATAGGDYTATSGTATFTGGVSQVTFTVPILGDTDVEGDETFDVTLSNPTFGATIGTGTGTVTIVDDEGGSGAPGSVTIADISVAEGNAGTSVVTLTLTRTGGIDAFSVDYVTADGGTPGNASATAGSDYAARSGTVIFGAGATTATVDITINGDAAVELAEEFRLLLSNATNGATIGDNTAVVTITNDDAAPASVRIFSETFTGFTAAGFAPTPTAGQLDSDVWRVGGLGDIVDPPYGFTGAKDSDFGRGVIAANPATAGVYAATGNAAIIVQPTGAEFDVNGFIEAKVQNTSGAAVGGFDVAFDWTYRNNETRSDSLQLSYSTDGTTFTAVPASNFTTPAAPDASPTFLTQNIAVNLTGLSVANGGFLYLRWSHLSSSGGGSRDEVGIDNVTVDTAGGTPLPTVAVSDVSVNEDAGTMTFTVSRANLVGGAFTLDYATANGTATAGVDYTATNGSLSFGANQVSATVTVTLSPDASPEFDETIFLNLTNASGANIIDAQGVGTIVNDDGTPISVSIADVSVAEGNAGTSIATFTVTRSGGTGAFDVAFATADGTATAGSDYAANTGTLNFAAGENSKTIQVTINGDTAAEAAEAFTVTLSGATNGALFTRATATGTIGNDDGTLIHDIQGTSYFSPVVAGAGITTFNTATSFTVTVQAVVTVLDGDGNRQGFYITEENADWDVNNLTSEGIFVMTRNDAGTGSLLSAAVPGLAVGDIVTVTANVMEYQGFATSMPVTTLVNPVVTIGLRAQPLPVLTLDSTRPIPNEIFTPVAPLYTDSVDDVGDTFDADRYALSYYETIEGMLVSVPGVVVADGFVQTSGGQPYFKGYSTVHANPEQINSRGGYTIAGDPINAPPDTANPDDTVFFGGAAGTDGDINPDIFEVDFTDFAIDAPAGLTNNASMGDQLGTLQGIVNFDFSALKLFVTAINPASITNGQTVKETTTLGSDTRALTVATFNVENLDPTDGAARFTALANAIKVNLNAPDIITIEEIQDNNGAGAGSPDASTTWQMLTDALNLATGKTYQWVDQEPVNGAEGGEPGGNIRVGFLYDTARVQLGDLAANATLAERRQFTDRIGDGVRDAGDRILYSDNMVGGEIQTSDWTTTRKSLLGQFSFAGNTVFVIGNHWPSKGGSGELNQFNQNPQGGQPLNSDWAQRNAVAQDVYSVMALIQAGSPAAGIVAGGDFNDFYFYTPLTTVTGYTNPDGSARVGGPRFDNLTVTKLTEAERYTYNFDGRSQAIDHIIVNNLLNGVASYDVVHINTGFNVRGTGIDASPALSDHDPAVASFDFRSLGEVLNGTTLGETITGLGGDDTIDGKGGADTLVGGIGDDVYIVDSLDDIVTELGGEGIDEVRTSLANYVLPANVERLVYTGPGNPVNQPIRGNSGDNSFTGSGNSDTFDLSDGGADTASGGAGNDVFLLGATFGSTDRIDGGDGFNDQLGIQGNYSGDAFITLNALMLPGVEVFVALPGFSYVISTVDDFIGAGVTRTIYASNLGALDSFTLSGGAESNGNFRVFGGGGADAITTGVGDDLIYFGPGRFNPATDTVNGGAGNDLVGLDGVYSLTVTGAMLSNIETLQLIAGPAASPSSYNIVLADSFTPAALQRTIDASAVTTAVTIDGVGELDGTLRILGGRVGDTLTGGGGADYLRGGLGGDVLTGGAGSDTYGYLAIAESTGPGYDTISGLTAIDRIQILTAVTGVDPTVASGALSVGTIDADLAAALGAGQLGAGHAVLFTPTTGGLAGTTFLVIDGNTTAGYQAGSDWVIQLTTPPASIAVENFIV